jgi:dipeptidyl aminopeptidase/acylaminoacyl peptidase
VQAVVDFFGPIDVAAWYRYKGETQAGLIGAPVDGSEEKLTRANPITYLDGGDPPVLVAHGRRDKLVPMAQSELFAAALRKAGVPVTLELVPWAAHNVQQLELDAAVVAFFDRHLKAGR